MKQLEGKYAVITGAGSGISYETALVFAERGVQGIITADLNFAGVIKAAETITSATGCNCIPYKVDVAIPEEIEALFNFVGEKFGRVDILVNGAGISPYNSIDEVDAYEWDKTLNINLRGTYLCAREAFKFMREQKYGKIVNVSSIAGRIGGIAAGINYSASKGGVISATMALAKVGAPYNIKVNSVAPGVINTPLTRDHAYPPGTIIGEPRDVAYLIAFLASDESNHIVGCAIDINGGAYMS